MFAGPMLAANADRLMREHNAAMLAGKFGQGRARLVAARASTIAVLSKSPADSYAWAGLAEITWRLGGASLFGPDAVHAIPIVRRYLAMSTVVGRYEHRSARVRTNLALKMWPVLDALERRRVDADIVTLLGDEAKHRIIPVLVDMVAGANRAMAPIVRHVIEREAPAALVRFDREMAVRFARLRGAR